MSLLLALPFTVLFQLVGLWMVWVCYLVWFRVSPLAVRQTCGAAAFLVFGVIMQWITPLLPNVNAQTDPGGSSLGTLLLGCLGFIVPIVALILAYRTISGQMERILFAPVVLAPS